MNERIANLASKIAAALITENLITEEQHELAVKTIGDAIHIEVHPTNCPDCGTILCPRCGAHSEAGVQPAEITDETPATEFELLPLCPYCAVYIKPDRTMEPVVFEKDRRYISEDKMQQMFGGENSAGEDEPPSNGFPPGWKN
jgi:hypothetical protein